MFLDLLLEAELKRVFSQRLEGPLAKKQLTIRLPEKLRRRIWYLIERFDQEYVESDRTGWQYTTAHTAKVADHLRERYGMPQLSVWSNDENRELVNVSLEEFILTAPGPRVFDAIELFSAETVDEPGATRVFQAELNDVLEQEHVAWRFADGRFFQVDSAFLAMEVVAQTDTMLLEHGFAGAHDEFTLARDCLAAEDYKGAILNAGKSLESVLKAILHRSDGNARDLIRDLVKSGFFSDLPEDAVPAMGEQILMTLPTLRNKLGGHGQGLEVVPVERSYAALAVHLAGAFSYFLVSRSVKRGSGTPPVSQTQK